MIVFDRAVDGREVVVDVADLEVRSQADVHAVQAVDLERGPEGIAASDAERLGNTAGADLQVVRVKVQTDCAS